MTDADAYPYDLDVRPLTTWPGELTPDEGRSWSAFKAPLRATLGQLRTELRQIGAENAVLEVAIPGHQFRNDGRPMMRARATHPGVVLSLPTTDVGPLRYACDRYWTWQENLRAITLGLEALRKVERYGITKRGEQYVGFRALPPGRGDASSGMTATAAAEILLRAAGTAPHGLRIDRDAFTPDVWRSYVRQARAATHPDKHAGDTGQWHLVDNAVQTLQRAGWLPKELA